ncbi:Lar family restriction alleviation protein [Streptomyces albidoflavus]|uniref:hypothetical protein n=1 Tax=Streptomyces TaxID=1883 RepID=UPI002A7ED967|nr:hypothetical protein [Streptomyces sp. S399]WPR52837.1 hypothetical protein SJI45_19060 [Streptomyces sp. S399]
MSDPTAPVPPGHSSSAHRAHGWCATCPGRTIPEELIAWRAQAATAHATRDAAAQAEAAHADTFDASVGDYRPCPKCGGAASLAVVTVTAATRHGRVVAGGWSYCLDCQATPHILQEATRG